MDSLSKEVIKLLNRKQDMAYDVIFSLFFPPLVSFANQYVSFQDSKNAVQDAFLSLWENSPEFGNEFQLKSYLYTAVKNNCLNILRREKLKKNFEETLGLKEINKLNTASLDHLDTSIMAFQEIETIISKTLSELPPRCKEIFILSRYEGKKNSEIADSLDISVKSVEAQITKALKIFKVVLKDYLPVVSYFLFVNQ